MVHIRERVVEHHPDGVGGFRSWDATMQRIKAGWEHNALRLKE
jgi:hypothetical protein